MTMNVGPLRRRPGLVGLLIVIPCIIVLLSSSPDMSSETDLAQKLAVLQARFHQLDFLQKNNKEEVQVLMHHLAQFLSNIQIDNNTLKNVGLDLGLLRNLTNGFQGSGEFLRLPSVYQLLPHLLESPSSLRLGYQLSQGRNGVSIVLGIPSVKREYQAYLIPTVRYLIEAMSPSERDDTLIVVLVAETDIDYVMHTANQLETMFSEHVRSGLIEVIAPHASYYPDLKELKPSLGDPPERVRWRSKQNLDYAFLMMYCQARATFYVQLEDDIMAKKNFISTMKSFALSKIAQKESWFVLVFCQLGFIGKMFKCEDLPVIVQFFLMFFSDKPVDWLIEDLITTKVCRWGIHPKDCKRAKSSMWVIHKPSLFQHIGTESSLKGKVQKLKDKHFGRVALYFPHYSNPKASLYSNIKPYKLHTLARAYQGETFFWGLLPESGDILSITFEQPILVKSYLFRSGNIEHPNDKFVNTTVEVAPAKSDKGKPEFVVVGDFDTNGLAKGVLNHGKITAIRLVVHSDTGNWVIISEIDIKQEKEKEKEKER